jgi:hypothetical protein
MTVGFLLKERDKGELHERLKTTKGELLVALGNIVTACFRWFFKLHQNSL